MGNMTWTDDGKYSGRLWTEGKLYTQKWENMKLWTEAGWEAMNRNYTSGQGGIVGRLRTAICRNMGKAYYI